MVLTTDSPRTQVPLAWTGPPKARHKSALLASALLLVATSAFSKEELDPPEPHPAAKGEEVTKQSQAETRAERVRALREERTRPGLWGWPVRRGGFHFQVGFGAGGGPDTLGLFHSMELGYTFGSRGQHTVALLHTFIQNKGMFGTDLGGPDLIGGWMLEYKHPLFFPDLVAKVALGLGGTHDQSGEGIEAHGGFGASYGLDLHLPLTKRFGPTLTLAGMHVTSLGQHHFGAGLALGVTLF